MVYSVEEKARMDNLITAFGDYIRNHYYFDIVYSEKIGYFRLVIADDDDEVVSRLENFDDLLNVLIDDFIMDEEEFLLKRDKDVDPSLIDYEKIRSRILEGINRLDADRVYCLDVMEHRLEKHKNHRPE